MANDEALVAEVARYRALLPELLSGDSAGRWVVFKDGAVQSVHEGGYEAWRNGTRRFGMGAPFVVSRVEAREPIRVGRWRPSPSETIFA